MSQSDHSRSERRRAVVGGVAVLALAVVLQGAVVSRLVATIAIKRAEKLAAGEEAIAQYLALARAADPSNGRLNWLAAQQHVRSARLAESREERLRSEAKQAQEAGDAQRAAQIALAAKAERDARRTHLDAARDEALRGARSFNSIDSLKQLGMIHMRLERRQEAESCFEVVARVKPDDFESIERLGMIKLGLRKWDELEALCEQILYKHPYSPNVYYYLAFIAQEKLDIDAFNLYLRQAYWMMKQEKGPVFFDRDNLIRTVASHELVDLPPPEASATPPSVGP